MVERTGRDLGDNGGKADSPTFGDERAMHSSGFSRAQHRAKIVRVFHPIEKHEKRRLISFLRPLENVLGVAIGFRGHERNDALVFSAWHQPVQGRLGLDMNGNPLRFCQLNDMGELSVDAKHKHPLQLPSVRPECLSNRMQPIQQLRRTNASSDSCRLVCPRG